MTAHETPMDAIRAVPELRAMLDGADHVDAKSFTGRNELPVFLKRMISYEPGWYVALNNVRGVVAKVLGLKHDEYHDAAKAKEVNLAPGGMVGFFTSVAADDAQTPRWWAGDASDKHLSAKVMVASTPAPGGDTRTTIATVVHYRHWTGPLYFNLIRPFHHIVIQAMGRYAASSRD